MGGARAAVVVAARSPSFSLSFETLSTSLRQLLSCARAAAPGHTTAGQQGGPQLGRAVQIVGFPAAGHWRSSPGSPSVTPGSLVGADRGLASSGGGGGSAAPHLHRLLGGVGLGLVDVLLQLGHLGLGRLELLSTCAPPRTHRQSFAPRHSDMAAAHHLLATTAPRACPCPTPGPRHQREHACVLCAASGEAPHSALREPGVSRASGCVARTGVVDLRLQRRRLLLQALHLPPELRHLRLLARNVGAQPGDARRLLSVHLRARTQRSSGALRLLTAQTSPLHCAPSCSSLRLCIKATEHGVSPHLAPPHLPLPPASHHLPPC